MIKQIPKDFLSYPKLYQTFLHRQYWNIHVVTPAWRDVADKFVFNDEKKFLKDAYKKNLVLGYYNWQASACIPNGKLISYDYNVITSDMVTRRYACPTRFILYFQDNIPARAAFQLILKLS